MFCARIQWQLSNAVPICFCLKIFEVEITQYTVNLLVRETFYSAFNYKKIHFRVHLPVIFSLNFFTFLL